MPNNTWDNFGSKVLIYKYWESIKKTKPSRQSNRVKVNNSILLNVCFIIPILLSLTSANPVNRSNNTKLLELDDKSPPNTSY